MAITMAASFDHLGIAYRIDTGRGDGGSGVGESEEKEFRLSRLPAVVDSAVGRILREKRKREIIESYRGRG